jgi:hypothetical protein
MTAAASARVAGLLAAVVATALGACAGSEPDGREPRAVRAPMPDGVVVHVDQSRLQRKGRQVFVRVENGTAEPLTITRLTLTSPRLPAVRWSGRERVDATYEADVELDLPTGRCGADLAAEVTIGYRLGDGPLTTSTAAADDVYGAVTLLTDRDCAEETLTTAADVTVGDPVVEGRGRTSVLRVPVTMTPTGRSSGVRFAGFESTVLFRQTADSPDADSPAGVSVPLDRGSPSTTQVLSVVPSRCDPHALAEDKVGTLFGVRVRAAGLGEDADYYLPLAREQRSAFLAFFGTHCGLSRP